MIQRSTFFKQFKAQATDRETAIALNEPSGIPRTSTPVITVFSTTNVQGTCTEADNTIIQLIINDGETVVNGTVTGATFNINFAATEGECVAFALAECKMWSDASTPVNLT